MNPTISDLGQKVKAKYPGEYDDLDDAEVGRRVKAKFPGDYDDFADTPSAAAPQQPQQPSALSRFGTSLANTTGIPQMIRSASQEQAPTSIGQAVKQGLTNAITQSPPSLAWQIGKNIWNQQKQQFSQAGQAFKEGNYYEAGGRALAGALPVVGPMAAQAGEQIRSGDVAGGLGTAVGAIGQVYAPKLASGATGAAGAVARGVGKAGAEIIGKTTGVGPKAFRAAASNPSPELVSAMRGATDEMDMLANLKDAFQNVKNQRGAQYRQQLAQIPAGPPLDLTQLRNDMLDALDDHGVNVTISDDLTPLGADTFTPRTSLDFSRSTISDKAAQGAVQGLVNDVMNWGSQPGDLTPLGVDTLKRRIDDLYSPSSNARALVQKVKSSARDTLNQVRGYQQMTKDYADASNFLDQLSDLSLTSKNPGTAIRKLTTTLNQNNNYRQMLVDELSKYSNVDLSGQIAGNALSRLAPRGIMGPGSGVALLYGLMTGHVTPVAATGLALTSPRLMGELAVAIGKMRPIIGGATNAAATTIPPAVRTTAALGNNTPQ